jgi:hypothetical protein
LVLGSNKSRKTRFPRIFGPNNLIIPYDYDHSWGRYLMGQIFDLKAKSHYKEEKFVYFDFVNLKHHPWEKFKNWCILLTDRRLVFV